MYLGAQRPPQKLGLPLDGDLSRRFLFAFLAAVVPCIVALAGLTIYSTRSLVADNLRLEQISAALDSIRGVDSNLNRASAILREKLLSGRSGGGREFASLLGQVDDKLRSCASVACHEAMPPLTPQKMAAMVARTTSRLKDENASLSSAHLVSQPDRSARLVEIDHLMNRTDRKLWMMSEVLAERVEVLGAQTQAMSRRTMELIILLAAAVVLVGSAVAIALGRYVSRPIRDLSAGVREVTGGDWTHRVKVRERGEIGELAASFNAMIDEIEIHRQELAEHNRTLEERVRLRTEELRKKDEILARSQRLASLGMIASGVAHELNNPLTSILMKTNLMMEELEKSSSFYQELGKIDQAALRCKRIVGDLKGLSPRSELDKKPCEVRTLVDRSLSLVRHELERRRIDVACEIPDALPSIVCDAERLGRVLVNLFMNAAEAMEERGRLVVRVATQDGWLKLAITDTGAGISPKNLPHIFDPFFTTKPYGTGLGLSLSHGIVDEHGGRIEVESRTRETAGPGEQSGTTLTMFLPLVEEKP